MRNKVLKLLALLLSASFILIGCGSGTETSSTADFAAEKVADAGGFDAKLGSFYAEDNSLEDYEEPVGTEPSEPIESDEEEYTKERKIVYTSSMSIETKSLMKT
ncbi:hypothetical protein CIY_23410 [Butyrivibrio fibrisolvens 16/4]|nr:hypothetical protein CIY_23410 [Butyrivibrio fibrisolvens 16/4]